MAGGTRSCGRGAHSGFRCCDGVYGVFWVGDGDQYAGEFYPASVDALAWGIHVAARWKFIQRNDSLEQVVHGFTKTESSSCFDKLSANGWVLSVAIKTVHPEPAEGGTPPGKNNCKPP